MISSLVHVVDLIPDDDSQSTDETLIKVPFLYHHSPNITVDKFPGW